MGDGRGVVEGVEELRADLAEMEAELGIPTPEPGPIKLPGELAVIRYRIRQVEEALDRLGVESMSELDGGGREVPTPHQFAESVRWLHRQATKGATEDDRDCASVVLLELVDQLGLPGLVGRMGLSFGADGPHPRGE